MNAHEEREDIRKGMAEGQFPESSPFLFSREFPHIKRLSSEEVGKPDRWFFLGDIHGDFLALHRQLDAIANLEPDFRIVLLGDIADRGPDSAECFLLLLKRAAQFPGQFAWIAGNHDICFRREEGKFTSSVDPSEFLEYLNGGPEDERAVRVRLGEAFIRLTALLPRAILFPDGLLATHGGFPLVDLQQKVSASLAPEELFAWLTRDECLQDFTWTRLTRYKRKSPNRLTKGCSYGYEDFEAFCKLFPESMPVRRTITGHEHFDEGWIEHPSYKVNPACSLTGFGFPTIGGPIDSSHYRDKWFVARHRENDLPAPLAIPSTPAEIAIFYPPSVPQQ